VGSYQFQNTLWKKNQSILSLGIQGVIAVALAIIAIYIVLNAGTVTRMWGIDGCYSSSITEVKNTDLSSWKGPNKATFEECLKNKEIDN
jgi:hypothetical protein